jgi:hypothetical protein
VLGSFLAGVALSAFFFSAIAHAFFPGNTSGLLLTLAIGTSSPMVLGWFLVRPCPHFEHAMPIDTESDNGDELEDLCTISEETSQLISKIDPPRPLDLHGLAMIRTIDFWILFCTKSLRKSHSYQGEDR